MTFAAGGFVRIHKIENLNQQIYNRKTAEYFKEVISSFYSNNLRSSIVMAYSVVICDLIYKLQELKDNYNDQSSSDILAEVKNIQDINPNSPDWESRLIELIKERTDFFEHSDYANITHLQKHRHLCAHPIIQSNDILYSPNQETACAHIINALECVLTKPALLSKKIFDSFLNDLKEIKNIIVKREDLERYISSKYFLKMNKSVEYDIFKSLWKIVLKISNVDCDENREINFTILSMMITRHREGLRQFISDNNDFFSNNVDLAQIRYIVKLMNCDPNLYNQLNESAKTLIRNAIVADKNLTYISFFLNTNIENHYRLTIEQIEDSQYDADISSDSISYLAGHLIEQGEIEKGQNLLVVEFIKSHGYDQADIRYSQLIAPNLSNFGGELLKKLIQGINENSQIYDRRNALWANTQIKRKIITVFPDFDFSEFRYFRTNP